MQLLAFLFAIAAHTVAFSLDTRSPALISRQAAADLASRIAAVHSATHALNSAISSGDLLALAAGNTAVVQAIHTATSEAHGLATLSFDDAARLATPIEALGILVDSTVTNLVSRSGSFAAARESVLDALDSQHSAASSFSTALLSKMPDNFKGLATSLALPFADSLARARAAYSRTSVARAVVTQISDGQIQAPMASAVLPSLPVGAMTASLLPASVLPASVLKPSVTVTLTPTNSIKPSTPPTSTPPASTPPASSIIQTSVTKPSVSLMPSAIGSSIPLANKKAAVHQMMPTLSTVTGLPSYSLPGSSPTASAPAVYTGAAASPLLAHAGVVMEVVVVGVGVVVAVAAF